MKKLFITALAAITVFSTASYGAEALKETEETEVRPASPASLAGGWQVTEDAAITPDIQAVFDKAAGGLLGASYEPIALLSTQVVAGTNYCFLCRITPVVLNPVSSYAFVYIYADLSGNARIQEVKNIEFGLSPVSDDEDADASFSPYDYRTGETANEEFLTFSFPDVRLYVPMEWEDRFVVETDEYGVSFYQKSSYDKYLEKDGTEHGGFLFRLSASEDESYRSLPAYRDLGYSENAALYFYLMLPTDVRAYNDPEIREDYSSMSKQIDLIAEKARIAPSLSFYPGESTDAGMS